MWEVSVFFLRIAIGLYPVGIQGIKLIHSLCCEDRGVAVTSVSLTFQMGAVDHVAALGQAFESVMYHIVYGIDVSVVAYEGGFGVISSVDGVGRDVVKFWHLVQSGYLDIAVGVIIEFVAEGFFTFAAGSIVVGEHASLKIAV